MRTTKFIALAMCLSILSTSCLGSFSAFNSLKDWNSDISDSKFVNNLIFWGLNIVPVYPLFLAGDIFIFNVIEFWSGSNPIAMAPGEVETQTIEKNGNTYKMIATRNQMEIKVIDGKKEGKSIRLFYLPEEQSWNAEKQNGEVIKLASIEDGFYQLYMPDGETIKMDINMTKEEGMALINRAKSSENCDTFYAFAGQ